MSFDLKRTQVVTPDVDGQRIRVRYETDPTAEDGPEGIARKAFLLRTLADNYELTHCGTVPFQTLKLAHDGNRWYIEVEAVVHENRQF